MHWVPIVDEKIDKPKCDILELLVLHENVKDSLGQIEWSIRQAVIKAHFDKPVYLV